MTCGEVSGGGPRGDKRAPRIAALRFRIDGIGGPAYKPTMRRALFSAALFLALLLAGYTGYWFYVAHRLAAGVEPWAEARRAQGYTLRWDGFTVSGYPSEFRLSFSGAVIGGTRPLPFEAAAPLLVGEARPWNLQRWRITASRGVHATAPSQGSEIAAAAIDGELALADAPAIDLTAHDVAGGGKAAGLAIAEARLQLTLPPQRPASHRDTAANGALRLTRAKLPQAVSPFGDTIETLVLAGSLKGAIPQGPLRQALTAWRDDGGTIELADAALHWGALDLRASGTLALDEAMQPEGSLTATVEDHGAVIDAAVAAGYLRAGDAHFIKTFLGLMAKPGPDGKKRLTVPLSLQNDRIYLGPAQVAALPRFTWE